MPYEVRKKEGSDDYEVINKDTGEVKATHEPPEAKEKAERQVRLLEAIEHDKDWDVWEDNSHDLPALPRRRRSPLRR